MKALSNFDIIKQLKNIKHFRGVYTIDTIPKKIKNEYSVLNTKKITDPEVGHWVVVVNLDKNKEATYFDSYGLPIPREILKYLYTSGKDIICQENQLQMSDSVLCGYFCIHLIKEMNKGKSFYDVVYSFKQNPDLFNEKKVVGSGITGKIASEASEARL